MAICRYYLTISVNLRGKGALTMQKQYQRKSRGFTIVETLIVLAIVGVMMVVVFLAVPALQRNSRNTSAKTEANNVTAAVNEFISNSGGKLPAASASSTNPSDAYTIFASANTKSITLVTVVPQADASAVASGKAFVVTSAKCVASVTGGGFGAAANKISTLTATGASRQFAVVYPMEDRSGDAMGCIDS